MENSFFQRLEIRYDSGRLSSEFVSGRDPNNLANLFEAVFSKEFYPYILGEIEGGSFKEKIVQATLARFPNQFRHINDAGQYVYEAFQQYVA